MSWQSFEDVQKYNTFAREPFYDVAIKYAAADRPVLDVGAGSGDFADRLKRTSIHLIEGNPDSAAALRRRYANVHELQLPARLPFADGFFGLIHCSHFIEHLQPQELYDLLVEFDRCLGERGHLVISTPLLWEGFHDDLSHVKPYNPMVIEKYLCPKDDVTLTRRRISDRYRIAERVDRFRVVPLAPLNVSTGQRWAKRFAWGISRALTRLNVGAYERTAYTLVLTKG